MKNTVVLYHKNCADGFGAAWAAWKKLGHRADYMAVEHQEPPPPGLVNKKIYLVDFSYSPSTTKKLLAENKQITALDHHVTAEEAIQLTDDYRYDPTHSGAVISWQYFHPTKTVPSLLKYIEDRDLWRWALPHTKEINTALELTPFDFNKWNIIARDMERARSKKKYIATGAILLQYRRALVDRLIAMASSVIFEDHTTFAVNTQLFHSEVGHALAKKLPPISITWYQEHNTKHYSLRSDGTIDVAAIAQKYGGGGHKAAAGFSMSANESFPWKTIL